MYAFQQKMNQMGVLRHWQGKETSLSEATITQLEHQLLLISLKLAFVLRRIELRFCIVR